MGFKESLRAIRKSKGMSQQQVGELVGKTREAVTRLESGATKPTADALTELAAALRVSTSELMGDSWLPAGAVRIAAAPAATVPMLDLGAIHAGDPIEAREDAVLVQVPADVAQYHHDGYLLHVQGDCMNRVYPDGCRVLVDPAMDPRPGCAVAAMVDGGDVVLRRYYRGADTLMLVADSLAGEYDDMVFKGDMADVRLLGVI